MATKELFTKHDRKWVVNTDSILYNSLAITIINLQVYGMYPVNNIPKWLYYCYACLAYCIFSLPIPTLVFAYMFVNRKTLDLVTIIDLLFLGMELAITIPKYAPIRFNPDRVRHTLEWLNTEEFNAYHKDQEEIAKRTSELFKKIFYIFRIACVFTLILVLLKPVLTGQKILPIVIWLPFDPANNNYYYVAAYFMIGIGSSNAALGNCSLDCIIVGLLFHATGQLKIIKGTLRDVTKHAEEKVMKNHKDRSPSEREMLKNKFIYEDICKCVDRYNLIKEFAKDIEDTYSFSIILQFAASIVVIGFACIQFFLVKIGSVQFYVIVVWIITMTSEVFLFCYFGSLLHFESATLVTDIYLTDWLELDQKSQKAYLIIIEAAKRPLIIRAGKIIDLSLDTFTTNPAGSILSLCCRYVRFSFLIATVKHFLNPYTYSRPHQFLTFYILMGLFT